MKINHCLRCNHEWASKLDKPRTCSKCRSPYWDIPRGSNSPLAAEASPIEVVKAPVAQEMSHHDVVRKTLDPNYEPAKRQTIEELKAMIAATPARKSVLPEYPKQTTVDQPDYYDNERSIEI